MALKSEASMVLDEVTRAGGSLLQTLRLLRERFPDTPEVVRPIEATFAALASSLEQLMQARRDGGELPMGTDTEKASVQALGLNIKARLSEQPDAKVLAEALSSECTELVAVIERAIDAAPDDLHAPLQGLRGDVMQLEKHLRASP